MYIDIHLCNFSFYKRWWIGAFNIGSYGMKTFARNSVSFFPRGIKGFKKLLLEMNPLQRIFFYDIFFHRLRLYRSPNKFGNAALAFLSIRAHATEAPKIIQYLLN